MHFRRGPNADWIEQKWIDILRHVRDGMEPPQPDQKGSSGCGTRVFALILRPDCHLGCAGLAEQAPLHPPTSRRCRRNAQAYGKSSIERTQMPPRGEAESYHTQMSYVAHSLFGQALSMHTLQQTTISCATPSNKYRIFRRKKPASDGVVRAGLRILAKFARTDTTPEECQRTSALACELVRRTSNASD